MKVLVTGATGLIGAHTVFELLKAGHQVRLLVRNRDKAEKYFAQHGITIEDYVVADMRDADAVRSALQGCDALMHAAAVVGVEKSRAEEIYQSNLQAMRAVVDTAVDAGVGNMVYVSSVGALCNDKKFVRSATVDESAAYTDSADAYRRSKADCDRHIRNLQKQGAPIQMTYPTAVLGPDDPGMSESNNAFRIFVSSFVPLTSSGFQIVDARDIAVAHVRLLERGAPANREDGRYIVGGHFQYWRDLARMCQRASSKWLIKFWLPDVLWVWIGIFLDHLKKVIPVDFPLTEEAGILVTRWVPVSSARIEKELGVTFRPTEETINDTAAWMRRAGHM